MCRNRLAKQLLWTPTADDEYDGHDINTPSLIPVFDSAFVSTATITTNYASASTNAVIPTVSAWQAPLPKPLPISPTHDDMTPHEDRTLFSIQSSDVDGCLEAADFQEWKSWSAPRRIAAIRRWVIHAAHKYGPVGCWAGDFGEQWRAMNCSDTPAVDGWLDGVKRRIKMGWSALSYLERAMEGELSGRKR